MSWTFVCLFIATAANANEAVLVVGLDEPYQHSFQVPDCGSYLLTIRQLGANVTAHLQGAGDAIETNAALLAWQPETIVFEACPDNSPTLTLRAKFDRYLDGRVGVSVSPLGEAQTAFRSLSTAHQHYGAKDYGAAAKHYNAAASAFINHGLTEPALFAAVSAAVALEADQGAAEGQARLLAAVDLIPAIDSMAKIAWSYHLARLDSALGDRPGAIERFEQLLSEPLVNADPMIAASVLNYIGLQYAHQKNVAAAREFYDRVLAFGDQIDVSIRSRVLNNLGGAYFLQGDPKLAREYFEQMYRVQTDRGTSRAQADALGNMVTLDMRSGDFGQALSTARQLLELQEIDGQSRGIARANTRIGSILFRLGDPDQAADYILRSLLERLRLDQAQESMESAMVLAEVTAKNQQPIQAALVAHWALARADKLGDGVTQIRILAVLIDLLSNHEPALPRSISDWTKRFLASHINSLADQAIPAGMQPDRSLLLAEFARLERDQQAARDHAKQARSLAAVQVRPDIELRAGLLLAQLSTDPVEKAKHLEQSYALGLELWRGVASPLYAHRFTDALREITGQRLSLCAQLSSPECAEQLLVETDLLRRSAHDRFGSMHAANANADLLNRRRELLKELKFRRAGVASDPQIGRLLLQLNSLDEQLAQLGTTDWAPVDMTALQERLNDGQLLVAHFLTSNVLFRWNINKHRIDFSALPLPKKHTLETFRDLITERRPVAELMAAGIPLTKLLIGEELTGVTQLMVLPDAKLASFPFAALPVPNSNTWIIEQRSLAILPHLATGGSEWRGLESVLAVGDPVYGSAQLTLPYSRVEVETIQSLGTKSGFRVKALTGEDATVEEFTRASQQHFDVAHLAIHGKLNAGHPELSELIFSNNGAQQHISFGDALFSQLSTQLVVLSACDSGRGYSGSFGPLGFVQALQQSAAHPQIVASLWPVADAAGPDLFNEFYQQLIQAGDPPSALAAAQIALGNGRRFSHPYYWAGYEIFSAIR